MKQYKKDVVTALEKIAESDREIRVKDAALNAGITRLNDEEVKQIVRAFCKRNPSYKPYIMLNNAAKHPDLWSWWENCVVSEHEYDDGMEDAYL